MKGIRLEIDKLTSQVTNVLIRPKDKPTRHIYDVSFYSLTQQCLYMAQLILNNSDVTDSICQSYDSLVKVMKEAIRGRPEDESDDESLGGNDEISRFLNTRKPLHLIGDQNGRGQLEKFLTNLEKKSQDTSTFLESISKVKHCPNPIQTRIMEHRAVQTEISCLLLQSTFPLPADTGQLTGNKNVHNMNEEIPQKIEQNSQKIQDKIGSVKLLDQKRTNTKKDKDAKKGGLKRQKTGRKTEKKIQKTTFEGITDNKIKINHTIDDLDPLTQNKSSTVALSPSEGFADPITNSKSLNLGERSPTTSTQMRMSDLKPLETQRSQIEIEQESFIDKACPTKEQIKINQKTHTTHTIDQNHSNQVETFNKHFFSFQKSEQADDLQDEAAIATPQTNPSQKRQMKFQISKHLSHQQKDEIRHSLAVESPKYNQSINKSKLDQDCLIEPQENPTKSKKTQFKSLHQSSPIARVADKNKKVALKRTHQLPNYRVKKGDLSPSLISEQYQSFESVARVSAHNQSFENQRNTKVKSSKAVNLPQVKKQNSGISEAKLKQFNRSLEKPPKMERSTVPNTLNQIDLSESGLDQEQSFKELMKIEERLQCQTKLTGQEVTEQERKILKKLKELTANRSIEGKNLNSTQIQIYVNLMEKTHKKACGHNCIHLSRFYDYLKKNNIPFSRRQFLVPKHSIGTQTGVE